MSLHNLSVSRLKQAVLQKGYRFFEQGDYNLNLIGIRAADTHANSFNDLLCVAFQQDGRWQLFTFAATTDPGLYWRRNPMNVKGTAVLVPGQYAGAFVLGTHRGYDALTQATPLPVFRDDDLDAEVDTDGAIDRGWHGINLHRAHAQRPSKQVDRWSAGCQVVADPQEFELLISTCKRAAREWGPRFTYTLITEEDLL